MKYFLKIIKWILLLGIIIFALLQIDDKQNEESIKWNQEVADRANQGSDAFYLQLGLFAPEDKDPIEFGKLRLEEAEKVYGNYLVFLDEDNFPIEFNDPIAKENLGFHLPKDFCALNNKDCIKSVKANSETFSDFLQSSKTLLSRYQKFLSLNDYQEITSANTTLYFGDFQQLVTANKLLQLNLLMKSSNLESDTLKLIAETRSKLAQSNSLIGKMVHLAIVQLNLDFYNHLLKEELILGENSIPNVTPEEFSLDKAIKTEHAVAAAQIRLQHAAASTGFFGIFKKLWHNVFYKENMSINASHQAMQSWREYSNLSSKEHSKAESIISPNFSFLEKYRNYGGWVLSVVLTSAYSDYSKRLHNLQTKINLLNWYRTNKPKNLSKIDLSELKKINNFETGSAYIDSKDKLLCLPVPIQHRKNHHCISI